MAWPPCFSRKDVQPDGMLYIEAFPMGMVINYHRGLRCSRTLSVFPNLARLLTALAGARGQLQVHDQAAQPQLRSQMHVDGNYHGPSFIVGLGACAGGVLWVLDESGDTDMLVVEAMRAGCSARLA